MSDLRGIDTYELSQDADMKKAPAPEGTGAKSFYRP
jgi:hypothetical protein